MNNSPWPMVALGEVLTQYIEYIDEPEPKVYPKLSVKLYGKGVVLDAPADGTTLKMKRHQIAKSGQVILSEIWGKKGAIGFVPSEGEGALCTSHFFLFDVHTDKIIPQYLRAIFTANYLQTQLDAEAKGTTGYAAVRPKHLLAAQIPLPPLTEQRRIVARIESLAAKVQAARELREQAKEEMEGLKAAVLCSVREKLLGSYPSRHLGNVSKITSGGTPSREVPDYWGGHIPWIKSGELQDTTISDAEEFITQEGVDNSSAKLFPVNTVLVALYGQGQTRGRTGLLKTEATTNQACCAILPAPEVLEPRFTQYWLRSLYYEMREQVRNGAQPNWNARMIKMIEIAIPPLPEQHRIVAHLDALQARLALVQQHQTATQSRLAALLPSLLDRAFKGEL